LFRCSEFAFISNSCDFPEDEDDPNDLTFSPNTMDDSLKSSETWSEQSLETPYVSVHLLNIPILREVAVKNYMLKPG
jgi:hypothetical protein